MPYLSRWQNLILPLGVIACVLVLLAPLPPALLDVLLAANMAAAIIILLTTLSVRTPLEFSVFPTLLLATTLSRLVLNVASTRLILTQAETDQLDAAGQVIRAFGDFVAANNAVVGLILFAIIVVIQFVVITKGATRISEVAARFALDGLPGRQMAIDADLNAGAIDRQEAQRRRQELAAQADFYGAMDGASKFVRGDAIAGLVIIIVNIVGGLCIGVFQAHMSLAEAGSVFTRLTIGDGLVTQTPALLISLAAAMLVTRSSQPVELPSVFLRQLFARPVVLIVAAGSLVVLVFTGLPAFPLLALAAGCAGLAIVASRSGRGPEAAETTKPSEGSAAKPAERRIEDYLSVDPVELEIGLGLIRLADPRRGGDLLAQITDVRRMVAAELGIVLPKVRVRDAMRLDRHDYCIKLSGSPVAQGSLHPERLLAIAADGTTPGVPGNPATAPGSQQPAVWIDPDTRHEAEAQGCVVLSPTAVLASHLRHVVRDKAAELLTRDATQHLLDELRKSSPAVVDELIPHVLKLGEVQQVLQRLLQEQVPIRQLGAILETLGDCAPQCPHARGLAERVRQRLGRTICQRYRDRTARLYAVLLDPALEDRLRAGLPHGEPGAAIRLPPDSVRWICGLVERAVQPLTRAGRPPVVLTGPDIRAGFRQLTATRLPQLVVLSSAEISSDTVLESVGMIEDTMPVAA
jgi:flagellar biosynthesis protein FlhA